jgi:hypothetical protein
MNPLATFQIIQEDWERYLAHPALVDLRSEICENIEPFQQNHGMQLLTCNATVAVPAIIMCATLDVVVNSGMTTAWSKARLQLLLVIGILGGVLPIITRAVLHSLFSEAQSFGIAAFGTTQGSAAVYTICMLVDILSIFNFAIGIHCWPRIMYNKWRLLSLLHQCVLMNGPFDSTGKSLDLDDRRGDLPAVIRLNSVQNIHAYLACRRLVLAHSRRMIEYSSGAMVPVVVSMFIYIIATVLLVSGIVTGVSAPASLFIGVLGFESAVISGTCVLGVLVFGALANSMTLKDAHMLNDYVYSSHLLEAVTQRRLLAPLHLLVMHLISRNIQEPLLESTRQLETSWLETSWWRLNVR